MNNFWTTLFDKDEQVCLSESIYGTKVNYLENFGNPEHFQFFSINPLFDSRKDANVALYRNILIEFDDLPQSEQIELLHTIPWSTLVWSGGKSYHAILSLETPAATRADYDNIVLNILKKVPWADPSVKNPSRFSRTPDALRSGSGNKQLLTGVRGRINNQQLEIWLGAEYAQPLSSESIQRAPEELRDRRSMVTVPKWTKHFLAFGSQPGQRNQDLYRAACDLLKNGWTSDEVFDLVYDISDLSAKEVRGTISSAAKKQRV